MFVFLDTEFTDFTNPSLISLALAAEDGYDFYAERTDYRREDCSDFVRQEVLPLLGRVPGAACTQAELTQRLRTWLDCFYEPVTLIFDSERDWVLLADACLGTTHKQAPPNVGEKVHLASNIITQPTFEKALNAAYSQALPPHHALADARALRAGFRAWKSCTFVGPPSPAGGLPFLKERQRKDAEEVRACLRSARSLIMFPEGWLKGATFTENPKSEFFNRRGEGWK